MPIDCKIANTFDTFPFAMLRQEKREMGKKSGNGNGNGIGNGNENRHLSVSVCVCVCVWTVSICYWQMALGEFVFSLFAGECEVNQ